MYCTSPLVSWKRALLVVALGTSVSCVGAPVNVAPRPPERYEKLGAARGRACGSLGFAQTGYYFIPILLNGRVERAYQRALASVPGATALVDTEVRETGFWYVLATARCTTIPGEAIT